MPLNQITKYRLYYRYKRLPELWIKPKQSASNEWAFHHRQQHAHLQPIKSQNVILHCPELKGLTPQFQHTREKKREREGGVEGNWGCVAHVYRERATARRTKTLSDTIRTLIRDFFFQIIFILPSLACFLRCIHLHTAIKVATCPKTTRVGNTVPDGFAGIEPGMEFVSSAHRSKAGGERWGRL